MRRRTRILLGAVFILAFVPTYALVAMALAQARPIERAAPFLQGLVYIGLGLAWIFPLMPVIRWMEKRDA